MPVEEARRKSKAGVVHLLNYEKKIEEEVFETLSLLTTFGGSSSWLPVEEGRRKK